MKILLIQVDKTQEAWLGEGVEIYHRRLKNYAAYEVKTINMPKTLRQRSESEQKAGEAKELLALLKPEDQLVLLDERGKEFTSTGFAEFIAQRQNASVKRLVFAIGGPFGFDEAVYSRAAHKIALSQMTFSHQMVRLFFAEQLYRAFTILKGEKYHHS